MLNELKKISLIKCPECKNLPIIEISLDNKTNTIKYICHKNKFEDISLEKFKDFLQPIKCKECQKKNGNNICYCGLFCEDDYLYHILISKHKQINIIERIIQFNNNETFKYFCFNCNKKFNENFKIEEHKGHYFFDDNNLIKYFHKLSVFIFENINKMDFKDNTIIEIIFSIFYTSLDYFQKGFYKYYLNLENIFVSIIYYFKDINNNIDNENELNFIIINNSIEDLNKTKRELEEIIEINLNKSCFQNNNKEGEEDYRILLLLPKLFSSTKNIFSRYSSIRYLDLSNFNTNNFENMSYMFHGCSTLTSLNLSNFNTNNVKDMSYMFSECSSLRSINLSSFNTINVEDMNCMFYECPSLKKENVKISEYGKKLLDEDCWEC